jgi:hypothetical protein
LRNLVIILLTLTYQLGYPCTFFNITIGNTTYFGNNEDWSDPATEIRFYPGDDSNYGFVSLGFTDGWAQGGVNEKGLCFDWFAGYSNDWKADPAKADFNGDMGKEILKKCNSVEEVIEYYNTYNEAALTHARPMYADANGNSIIIKWVDGKVEVEYKTLSYQLIGAGEAEARPLLEHDTTFTIPYLASILKASHREGSYPTQYSNIFNLNSGTIYLFNKRNYDECLIIDLKNELSKGYVIYSIDDLFQDNSLGVPVSTEGINTGIREYSKYSPIAIFPNPTDGKFHIRSNTGLRVTKVFDLQGKEIFRQNFENESEGDIDLSMSPRGVYNIATLGNKRILKVLLK